MKTHALAGREQPGPVAGRRRAVHEIGVGVAGDVGEVGRAHAHLGPHLPLVARGAEARLVDIAPEARRRHPVEVVVMALDLELGEDPHRILVGPFGQVHDIVPVGAPRRPARRIDDDRAVHARLFLEAAVRVVPVGPGLAHFEAVGEGLAGRDPRVADTGHAVHVERQQDAVPVYRARLGQAVGDAQRHRVALAPAQRGCRNRAVDGRRHARPAGKIHRCLRDREVELGAAKLRWRAGGRLSFLAPGRCQPGRRAIQHAAAYQTLEEPPAADVPLRQPDTRMLIHRVGHNSHVIEQPLSHR